MSGVKNIALERSNAIVVGVADMQVSDNPQCNIITYALGSCIAVCLYDSVRGGAAGMIHYMLPQGNASPDKAKSKPSMFADTGVPLLFKEMYEIGCMKENLVVKLVGGGNLQDEKGIFNIGKRNHTLVRKLLWKNSIMINAEDVGGQKSRTVRLYVGDGRVVVSSHGKEREL